ncbi:MULTISPECIES: hypothetical protein [Spirulina sp. CCY15215]|uniref:hypothetical protein n=1 Tax=Spirulina sp. CCY15215 TaxID=2767591 RepID=UPI00194F3F05|nr:hypothetical protein [Spirulina major]
MDKQKQVLAQTMSFLMSIRPESNLGKLLNFCLATKVESEPTGKTAYEMACDLLEHPNILSDFIQEAMESDGEYTPEEYVALSELPTQNPEEFMQKILGELDKIEL